MLLPKNCGWLDLSGKSPSSLQLRESSRLRLSSLSLHCGLENLPEQSCEAIVGLTFFISNTLRSLMSSALKTVVSYIVSVSCLLICFQWEDRSSPSLTLSWLEAEVSSYSSIIYSKYSPGTYEPSTVLDAEYIEVNHKGMSLASWQIYLMRIDICEKAEFASPWIYAWHESQMVLPLKEFRIRKDQGKLVTTKQTVKSVVCEICRFWAYILRK